MVKNHADHSVFEQFSNISFYLCANSTVSFWMVKMAEANDAKMCLSTL